VRRSTLREFCFFTPLCPAELPIYETWTDEYMKKNFGHELVEVEEGKKVQRARSI